MKITLIQCPVWGTYDPPLAIAQLSSCLKKESYEVNCVDLNVELYLNRKVKYKDMWAWEQSDFWYSEKNVAKFFVDNQSLIEAYVNRMLTSGSQVFCFSVSSSSYLASLELAKVLKKRNCDLIIIFGGTLFFDKNWIFKILDNGNIDFVIYGEGETTLTEVVKLISKGSKDFSLIKGIAFKKNDEVFIAPPQPYVDLNSLPFLDFKDLSLEKYDDSNHITLMASRGCVQSCVFCSSKSFWQGYRTMSGERIFEEVKFHRDNYPKIGHIDFVDLLFNGNMKTLISFCNLMVNSGLGNTIRWAANVIIRPEMTLEITKKMKAAGCVHLIYGIETGSQHLLDLMRKRYKIIDADKVLKATHDAGITVTGNFMFGFPGETEEDFRMTLDFIKRNAKYLDRVYPSRTFCAIEEFSYLVSHLEEFNINPNPPNHLYWETIDGKNTYPDRLRRCEEFCDLAYSLGIEVGCGVQTSTELDKWFNLGLYYEAKKNHQNAIECYLKYYKLDNKNEVILNKIKTYNLALENNNTDLFVLEKTRLKLMDILNSLNTFGNEDNVGEKMKRERSIKLEKNLKRDNSAINDEEIQRNRIALDSIPKLVFIQASGPCNSYCTFCSRGHEYDIFNLEDYRKRFEEKLVNIVFPKIECLALTGSGEFLLLKEAEAILDYFDNTLPHVNKMIFTNGSSLTPQIADKIINSKSKYIIHFSLHSSNALQHKVITRTDHFHRILGNLNYLLKSRKNTDNPAINLIFVATTLNIEDLPNFVKLAATLQVNKVLCYYNYIYMPSQKYLSCFFKQELTNKMIDEAADIASKLNVALSLPPKFNQKEYPDIGICREPWGQIMIDFKGRVIPCDVSGDCQENLEDKEFSEVWNSLYYQELRKSLLNKTAPCYKRCIRANPSSVDDFSSHVIHRGGRKDIDVLWADNF